MKLVEQGEDGVGLLFEVEPDIERDLVVTRPPGMELAPEGAYDIGQPLLHEHMDILHVAVECKPPRG